MANIARKALYKNMLDKKDSISYHVCDFLIPKNAENNEPVILEWGNAWYGSNFSGRKHHNKINPETLMLNHLLQFGTLKPTFTRIRNELHSRRRWSNDDYFSSDDNISDNNQNPILVVKSDSYRDCHFEEIQTFYAAYIADKESTIVLDGAIDTLWLLDRDKFILNKFLSAHNLSSYQPQTWYFDADDGFFEDELPGNLDFFIIKPTNGSLAEGVIIVSKEELPIVLNCIKNRSLDSLTIEQHNKYKDALNSYLNDPSPIYRRVIIQEFIQGSQIKHAERMHQATGRAVFAVVKEKGSVRVDILDLYWQLALSPVQSQSIPEFKEFISVKGYQNPKFNCWPSFSDEDKHTFEPLLKTMFTNVAAQAFENPLKNWLPSVNNAARHFMKADSHNWIYELDVAFINQLLVIDKSLATKFLVEQSKYFVFGRYLSFKQEILANWIVLNLHLFDKAQLTELKSFLEEQNDIMKRFPQSENNYPSVINEFEKALDLKRSSSLLRKRKSIEPCSDEITENAMRAIP